MDELELDKYELDKYFYDVERKDKNSIDSHYKSLYRQVLNNGLNWIIDHFRYEIKLGISKIYTSILIRFLLLVMVKITNQLIGLIIMKKTYCKKKRLDKYSFSTEKSSYKIGCFSN